MSNRRVESYARQVSADVHDARTLLDTFPAGRTRDRMTELLSRAESRANDIQREVSRGGGGGGGGGRLRGPRVMSPEEFSSIYNRAAREAFEDKREGVIHNDIQQAYLS